MMIRAPYLPLGPSATPFQRKPLSFPHFIIDQFFNIAHLRGRQGSAAEVERQLVRPDVGTLLHGIRADDFVQGPVQQMSDAMMAFDGVAAVRVYG